MKRGNFRLDSITDVLENVIEARDLRTKIDKARLRQKWEEILGDMLASNLTIISFDNGHLTVKAADPSWSQEASMKREQIRSSINDYFGYEFINSIRISN